MKSILKKMFSLVCILFLIAVLGGCTTGDKTEPEGKQQAQPEQTYSKELAGYFPTVEGTVLKYNGTAEYGHSLTLSKVTDKQDQLILNFKGEVEDVSDGEGKRQLFETEYVIGQDAVREVQKNTDPIFSQSIMREQVVLKLPIEEGNTWKQPVNIAGKDYEAETKIIEISKDEKDKSMVKTETVIKGIENYPDNTYKEVKTFKEGKGIFEFNTIILLTVEKQEQPVPFEFGYRLFEQE